MHLPVGLTRVITRVFFCPLRPVGVFRLPWTAPRPNVPPKGEAMSIVVLAIASAVFIALGIVLTRFGLRGLGPISGGSVSVPTSALMFLAISPWTVDYNNWHWGAATIFAAAGLIYPAAVTLLNFASNERLGPNMTAAMGNLTPLFAIALAMLLLHEYPRPVQAAGVGVVIAGLFLVTTAQMSRLPSAALILLGLPLAAAILRGAAQPLVKIGLQDWPNAFAAAMLSYAVSAVTIWIVRLARRGPARPFDLAAHLWFMLIGVSNGLGLAAMYAALALGSVHVVAPIVASYPLITMALTWALHGREPLSKRALIGTAISVAGVVLVLRG